MLYSTHLIARVQRHEKRHHLPRRGNRSLGADLRGEEVARVQGPIEVEVVRGILESYGIAVSLGSRLPIWPFTVDGLGEVRIFVAPAAAATARDVLARHRRAGLLVLRDDDLKEEDPSSAEE